MAVPTLDTFVHFLGQNGLLEPEQLEIVERDVRPRHSELRELVRDLIERDLITDYQVRQISQGRAASLVMGQYLILDQVGLGGMGEIFKARHRALGRVVALKIIRQDRLNDADLVRRFRREIQAAAQLVHPNVVLSYDADEINGVHFYVMEFVDGMDLSRFVKERGPLPIARACDCIRQAALGLQHAHERGLVHRDIKPANLLLTSTGIVKILDMGLARWNEECNPEAAGLTHNKLIGTPDYIAPEQARDSHNVDIRSDLYSLGCTFYFLLTGTVPFPGGTSVMERLLQHQTANPVPVEQVRPETPQAIRVILGRLITRKIEDRFQTPAELAQALAPLCTGANASNGVPPPARAAAARLPDSAISALPQTALAVSVGGIKSRLRSSANWRRLSWPVATVLAAAALVFLVLIVSLLPTSSFPFGRHRNEFAHMSALDRLEPARIPKEKRFAIQLVAILGEEAMAHRSASGRSSMPNLLALYPGEETVVVGSHTIEPGDESSNMLKLWDLKREQERILIKDSDDVNAGWAYDPGRSLLASAALERAEGDKAVIQIWDANTGKKIAALEGMEPRTTATALAFSAEGRRLAAATLRSQNRNLPSPVRIWDVGERRVTTTLRGQRGRVAVLGFAPDGQVLGALSEDETLTLWNLNTQRPRNLKKSPGRTVKVSCFAFAPDGKTIATGGARINNEAIVSVWDYETEELKYTLTGHRRDIQAIAWATGSTRLAASAVDGQLILWRLPESERVHQWALPTTAMRVVFNDDGRYLLTANGNGAVYVLRLMQPSSR